MTYLFNPAQVIEVESDELGAPVYFLWHRRKHVVDLVCKRWRIDENWWEDDRQFRDYFKLATKSGLLIIIYRDLVRKSWRLQRMYD